MSAADNKKLVQEIFAIAGDPDPAVREKEIAGWREALQRVRTR